MKFVQLKPEEFTKYAQKSAYKSFLQTIEIANLREKNGWVPYYFGVKKEDKIIAATMVVAKPTFLGKSTFYIPGGPLLDYEDTTLINFFFKNLKNYAKTHNGYLLHIEPYYEIIERDKEGEKVEGGFYHQKAVKSLQNLGFVSVNSDNPKYLFVLELKGRKEDELFASFKQNTRNLISRTSRKGVRVRELKREELKIFKQITESTSERRHFNDKTLDYYETMYDLFAKKDEVKFVIAEVPNENLENIRSKSHEELAKMPQDKTEENGESKSPHYTPIAAAMFMAYGNEVIYLFSGSEEKYMKEYNAQYAIQWYMIKYALKNKFKRYNFYGIQGLPDPSKPGYGIYKFKKGFGGHVVELLGAYELSVDPLFYNLHKILSKIKHSK